MYNSSARGHGLTWFRALGRRVRPYALPLLVASALGLISARAIIKSAGGLAVPLDDAYIHFQYARQLAEGSFFSYVRGEGYSSGATSPLWPAAMAPFYLVGLRGLSIIYVAWVLGGLAYAALAVETTRLAERLTGRTAAIAAGAMSLGCGGFVWFASSGMETVAFAWILMRTARVAAEWCESGSDEASWRARAELLALGVAVPLLRPEGVLGSMIAASAIVLYPRYRSRLFALVPLGGVLLMPFFHRVFTGHWTASTTVVKWLVKSPYLDRSAIVAASAGNLRILLLELVDAGKGGALFLPERAGILVLFGFVALVIAGVRRRALPRAFFTLVVASGSLIPCTYGLMLTNRSRYVAPFEAAWFVGVACLASLASRFARLRTAQAAITALLAGGFAGALAARIAPTIRDLAQSSRAIERQQVTLARWAAANLPKDARIGVNDTGAIAYLSERKTFDIVGLTTEGEARHWAAGAGSRIEHYEKLGRERLPTHFIVYPSWMACPPVLGPKLTEATVTDQSILGGATAIAYPARWDLLGSGALPAQPVRGRLVDELDVADLDAEQAHAYELAGAREWDDRAVALDASGPGGKAVLEGGRFSRSLDRFLARAPAAPSGRLSMRLSSDKRVELVVRASGRELGVVEVPAGSWVERTVELTAPDLKERMPIEVVSRIPGRAGRFNSFHYWLYVD